MIYFYSGTGNTRFCAEQIAEILHDRVHFIFSEGELPLPRKGERIGFMFPIYSWGVPPAMTKFISSLPSEYLRDRYLWGCCTCGDEAGIAMDLFSKHIEKERGCRADALFSIIMPNDYVMLPGFDVDPDEVAEKKLAHAPERIKQIAEKIQAEEQIIDVVRGSMPSLRTRLVFPLFKHWGVNPKKWRVSDNCISCGRCATTCPSGNIILTALLEHEPTENQNIKGKKRPTWGSNCLSCCACFHVCPTRAIDYGRTTISKGQYSHFLKK